MKHSELLKQAKKAIKSRKHRYICVALQAITGYKYQKPVIEENQRKALEIVEYIESLLGQSYTVESWLFDNHKIMIHKEKHYRDYRLRWLDKLIEDYEKAGK